MISFEDSPMKCEHCMLPIVLTTPEDIKKVKYVKGRTYGYVTSIFSYGCSSCWRDICKQLVLKLCHRRSGILIIRK